MKYFQKLKKKRMIMIEYFFCSIIKKFVVKTFFEIGKGEKFFFENGKLVFWLRLICNVKKMMEPRYSQKERRCSGEVEIRVKLMEREKMTSHKSETVMSWAFSRISFWIQRLMKVFFSLSFSIHAKKICYLGKKN